MGSRVVARGRSSRRALPARLLLPHRLQPHELQDRPTPNEDAVTKLHADQVAGVKELPDCVRIQVQELA